MRRRKRPTRGAAILALDAARRRVAAQQELERADFLVTVSRASCDRGVRLDAHRAELVQVEHLAVAAHAALAEEHGPGELSPHGERRAQHHRREHHQQQQREDTVERVLERELKTPRVDGRE